MTSAIGDGNGDMTGLDLLRLLRATYSRSELPVIVVTPPDGESAQEVLRSGANDYVTPPVNLPEVAARIETQLSRAKTEQSLKFLDPLTGLGNRAALLAQLSALISGRTVPKRTTSRSLFFFSIWMVFSGSTIHLAMGPGTICSKRRRAACKRRCARWLG